MKKGFLVIVSCFLPLIFFCSGCSTLDTHGLFDNEYVKDATSGVYRGTKQNITFIVRPKYELGPVPPDPNFPITHKEEALAVSLGLIDFPFSLTADTLVFPYDIATIKRDESNREINAIMDRQTQLH